MNGKVTARAVVEQIGTEWTERKHVHALAQRMGYSGCAVGLDNQLAAFVRSGRLLKDGDRNHHRYRRAEDAR